MEHVKIRKKRRIGYKTKRKIFVFCVLAVLLLLIVSIYKWMHKPAKEEALPAQKTVTSIVQEEHKKPITMEDIQTLGWELQLVNHQYTRNTDADIVLAEIDEYREVDERILENVNQMINDMREAKIENVWVQSAYRSYSTQKQVYEKSIRDYIEQGKTKKEAEALTQKKINIPGTSEHELGLAIDFNLADESFAEMKGFDWLEKHAEEYGFILRYPKEKEDITNIQFEPWHWRYVGKKNAMEMNDKHMCLEEYVAYKLQGELS